MASLKLIREPSSTMVQQPSCSTKSNWAWTKVVVRSRKRVPRGASSRAPSPVGIPDTNKYSILLRGKEPDRQLEQMDTTTVSDVLTPLIDRTAFPSLMAFWPSTVRPLTIVYGSAKGAHPGRCEVAPAGAFHIIALRTTKPPTLTLQPPTGRPNRNIPCHWRFHRSKCLSEWGADHILLWHQRDRHGRKKCFWLPTTGESNNQNHHAAHWLLTAIHHLSFMLF